MCSLAFRQARCLIQHSIMVHGSADGIMCACDKVFPDVAKLKHHQNACQGIKPYKCVICRKTYSRKFKLKRHTEKCSWWDQRILILCTTHLLKKMSNNLPVAANWDDDVMSEMVDLSNGVVVALLVELHWSSCESIKPLTDHVASKRKISLAVWLSKIFPDTE